MDSGTQQPSGTWADHRLGDRRRPRHAQPRRRRWAHHLLV